MTMDPARAIRANTTDDALVAHSVPMVAKIQQFNGMIAAIQNMATSKKTRVSKKTYGGKNIPRDQIKSNQPAK